MAMSSESRTWYGSNDQQKSGPSEQVSRGTPARQRWKPMRAPLVLYGSDENDYDEDVFSVVSDDEDGDPFYTEDEIRRDHFSWPKWERNNKCWQDVRTRCDESGFESLMYPGYRREPSGSFTPGRIFLVQCIKPYNGQEPDVEVEGKQVVRDSKGTPFYTGFRRLIVIANDEGHCTCVYVCPVLSIRERGLTVDSPIWTYRARAYTRKGLMPKYHGTIQERSERAIRVPYEPPLGFPPVRADLLKGEKISSASRVNYSRLISIEHNNKVLFIGNIVDSDLGTVQSAVDVSQASKQNDKRGHIRKNEQQKSDTTASAQADNPSATRTNLDASSSAEQGTTPETRGGRTSGLSAFPPRSLRQPSGTRDEKHLGHPTLPLDNSELARFSPSEDQIFPPDNGFSEKQSHGSKQQLPSTSPRYELPATARATVQPLSDALSGTSATPYKRTAQTAISTAAEESLQESPVIVDGLKENQNTENAMAQEYQLWLNRFGPPLPSEAEQSQKEGPRKSESEKVKPEHGGPELGESGKERTPQENQKAMVTNEFPVYGQDWTENLNPPPGGAIVRNFVTNPRISTQSYAQYPPSQNRSTVIVHAEDTYAANVQMEMLTRLTREQPKMIPQQPGKTESKERELEKGQPENGGLKDRESEKGESEKGDPDAGQRNTRQPDTGYSDRSRLEHLEEDSKKASEKSPDDGTIDEEVIHERHLVVESREDDLDNDTYYGSEIRLSRLAPSGHQDGNNVSEPAIKTADFGEHQAEALTIQGKDSFHVEHEVREATCRDTKAHGQSFATTIAPAPQTKTTHLKPRNPSRYTMKYPRNTTEYFRSLLQPGVPIGPVPAGHVRVSWRCRCGDRLGMDTRVEHQARTVAFAEDAAGSAGIASITIKTSSASSVASNTPSGGHSGSEEAAEPSSAPSSVNDTDEQGPADPPTISADTPKYMLLCVNTGQKMVELANVNVGNAETEEVFRRLRRRYDLLRDTQSRLRRWLWTPQEMDFVKFELFTILRLGERVDNIQKNSVPSPEEAHENKYHLRPCSKGRMPIPPNVFMHAFVKPGEHLGPMTTELLPKKLHTELLGKGNVLDVPYGWGFYINEGWNRGRLWTIAYSICSACTLVGFVYSVVEKDVQSGMAVATYGVAVITLFLAMFALGIPE